jgi:hypothetical protein
MDNKEPIIILAILFGILILLIVPSIPFTLPQFYAQATDLNYIKVQEGDYNAGLIIFDGNKLTVVDINNLDINFPNPDLTGFVPYVGADKDVYLNGNIRLPNDNNELIFGAGGNASIGYNGTNLGINPKVVGSGFVDVQGGLKSTEGINVVSLNDADSGDAVNVSSGRSYFGGGVVAQSVLVNESSPYDNSVMFEVNGVGGFADYSGFSAYFLKNGYAGSFTDGTRNVYIGDGYTALYASDGSVVANLAYNGAAGQFEDGVNNIVNLADGTNVINAVGTTILTGALYNEGSQAGYNLDIGTTDGYGNKVPAGLRPDAYGLPIIDFGINPIQFGGMPDLTSGVMGTMLRLDNRGYYPYFQLIRQPADDTYSEYGDLMVSSVDGSVIVGDGWYFSNTGTGNGEDLQVFSNGYVAGIFNVAGGNGANTYLGTNKVTNGTFTGNANSWVVPTGWAYSSNTIVHNSNGTGSLSQNVNIEAGKQYRLTLTMSSRTAGALNIYCGGAYVGLIGSNGTNYSWDFMALTDENLFLTPTLTTSRYTLDNIKVEQLRYSAGSILVGDYDYLPNNKIPSLGVKGTSVLDGNVKITGDTNFDGNIIYNNTYFDDISFDVATSNKPGSKPPVFDENRFSYYFEDQAVSLNEEYLFASQEAPHGMKLDSNITCHIHAKPDTTYIGDYNFQLCYFWNNIMAIELNKTCLTTKQTTDGNAFKMFLTNFPIINGTGKTLSSTLKIELKRLSAATSDTFTGNVYVESLGCHYEIDRPGSRQEVIK